MHSRARALYVPKPLASRPQQQAVEAGAAEPEPVTAHGAVVLPHRLLQLHTQPLSAEDDLRMNSSDYLRNQHKGRDPLVYLRPGTSPAKQHTPWCTPSTITTSPRIPDPDILQLCCSLSSPCCPAPEVLSCLFVCLPALLPLCCCCPYE